MNWKRLKVFLVSPPECNQKRFQTLMDSVTISGCIDIINQYDWRCANNSTNLEVLMSCDMLIVVGDFISDKLGCCLINIAYSLDKTIVQWTHSMKHKTVAYLKTIQIQRILAEYCSCQAETISGISMPFLRPITLDRLRNKNRESEFVMARVIFCYLCRTFHKITLEDIGWLINRDRTTVIYLLEKFNDWHLSKTEYQFNKCANLIIERLQHITDDRVSE